jgi:DNA-binding PadR family transcriptional regulator
MSLRHAILTALLEKPASGADLARRFDRSFGFFWPATHQQIYRELGGLERDGMVRSTGRDSSRGRAKDYEVLPAGRLELADWTGRQQDPRPVREELMIRLRASAVLDSPDIAPELRRHLELHRRQLGIYLDLKEQTFPPGSTGGTAGIGNTGRTGRGGRLQLAVLEAGIMFERAWIEWAEETLESLAD